MSKRKFIILSVIFSIIAILLIARIIMSITKQKISVNDFTRIKELVEYDGHKYISAKNSEEKDFEKDIYIEFSKNPIEENGKINQNLYEILISHVSGKMLGNNFRIIDEEKNITIRIKFDQDKISTYTINNDYNYWKNLSASYQISIYSREVLTNFKVTSPVLINLINNNWNSNGLNFGSKDSEIDNYAIYEEEGYKIRTINSKIYNIVFTKKYVNTVINQITTQTNIKNVEQILGKPTLKSEETDVIGYKNNNIYIFFGNDEISVYPVEEYNEAKNIRFASLVTSLNKSGDVNTFLNRLTDLYPDYETYYRTENFVKLVYPLKGFEVIIGATQNNGITIYNNYQGQVTEDVSVENIVKDKNMPANVYTKFEQNLVLKAEQMRIAIDEERKNPNDDVIQNKKGEYVISE